MKKVHIQNIEDLTDENFAIFEEGLIEIRKQNSSKTDLLESSNTPNFDSLENYLEYYDAVPFDEFDKKFRSDV